MKSIKLGVLVLIAMLCATPSVTAARQSSEQVGTSSQDDKQTAPAAGQSVPVLRKRPVAPETTQASSIAAAGKIHLDVTVTDATGEPLLGLEPGDFKVLDGGKPTKILSFRSFDGGTVKPNPPVEVILLIDTLNLPFAQVAFTRQQLGIFLQQNGGHLAQPVSLMLLSDAGLSVQPRPSVDGNALVSVLGKIKGGVHTLNPGMGVEGDVERFQRSLRQMSTIAENEARMPGRKLLIWVGPGWPMLDSSTFRFSAKDQQRYFDETVELSTRIREARMTLYSVSAPEPGSAGERRFLYQDYLRGVAAAKNADTGNLGLKVLVTQSGGRILGPDNDLAGQIDQCIKNASAFYSISFNPPIAEHADEYRDLKVVMSEPGAIARTSTGYYDQPVTQAGAR